MRGENHCLSFTINSTRGVLVQKALKQQLLMCELKNILKCLIGVSISLKNLTLKIQDLPKTHGKRPLV
jgi:hypothetical protein